MSKGSHKYESMSNADFYKSLKNLFWYIISAVLITCGTFLFTSYTSLQSLKANDARQDILIDKKVDIESMKDDRDNCKEDMIAVEKRCNDRLATAIENQNQKLDLLIQLQENK